MKNPFYFAALTGALMLLPLLAVQAKPASQDAVDTDSTTTANLAFVGGTSFLRLHTSWGGLSPQERATQVQDRVNAAFIKGPIYPSDITVGQMTGDWVVLLRGKRFFTANPGEASYQHTAPQALAEQWATLMRHVLPDLSRQTEIAPVKSAAAP